MLTISMPPRPTPQASVTGKRGRISDLGHTAVEPSETGEPNSRRGCGGLAPGARTWSCWTSVGKTSPLGSRDDIDASAALAPNTEETSAELQACVEAGLVKLSLALRRLVERHRKDLQELKAASFEKNQKSIIDRQRAAGAVPMPPLMSDQPLSEDSDESPALYRFGFGDACSRRQAIPETGIPSEGPSPLGGDIHGHLSMGISRDSRLDDAASAQKKPLLAGPYPVLDVWKAFNDEEISQYLWVQELEASIPMKLHAARTSANWSEPSMHKSRGSTTTRDFALLQPLRCSDTFHPQSSVRLLWNVCTIIYVLYDIVMVPLQAFRVPGSVLFTVLDCLCSCFWTLDIFMSFKTAIYVGPKLESRLRRVAWAYVRTWFFMDLWIVVVGWMRSAVDHVGRVNSNIASVIKVFLLLRLCRVMKVMRSAKVLQERVNSDTALLGITIAKLLISLLILIHLISCTWYWLGEIQSHGWTKEENMKDADFFYRYFAAARWTIAQLSLRTDIELRTAVEYMFTCIVCLVGLVFVSACISQVTNVGIELSRLNKERSAKMRLMHGFLHRHALSTELTNTVMWYFKEMRSARSEEQKQWKNLEGLPHHIHMEVLNEVNRAVLSAHPYMHDVQSEFPQLMYQICTKVVKPKFVQEQDYLFAPGDACSRMLFVGRGRLQYVLSKVTFRGEDNLEMLAKPIQSPHAMFPSSDDDTQSDADVPVATVRRGQWISEVALWCKWEARGFLTAKADASLLTIEAQDFGVTIASFKDAHIKAQLYAVAFVKKLAGMEQLSDMSDPPQQYLRAA